MLLVLSQYGLIVVGLNVLLNQIGLPVPAIPTLIVAGAAAANGQLSFGAVFSIAVAACLMADCSWFFVGQRYGIRVLRLLCRISLEPDSCVSQTQNRFEHWGVNSIVIAKFVPGLSIIAPPLAGAMGIGWLRFLLLSVLAGALWAGAGLAAGMLFRTQIVALLADLSHIGSFIALTLGVGLAAYIGFKWLQRMRFYRLLRMARISVSELYQLIQAGGAPVIVDVRSATARALQPSWIPGALHVPLRDVAKYVQDLPRDREIILYCTCPSEASAARVAKLLMKLGFKKVRPLHGGLDAWVAAGYTVEHPA